VRFLIRWIVNVIALFVVLHIVAGVSVDNWQSMVIAALFIGLFNAFLRPLMIVITLPLTILTFGFFTLIINAFIFYLVAKFVPGFVVLSFWSAFWASLIFSIISFALNMFLNPAVSFKAGYGSNPPPQQKKYSDAIDVEGRIEDTESITENQGGSSE